MAKKGLTAAGNKAKADSSSGVRHGASVKNTVAGGRSPGKQGVGSKVMSPIKGANRGGMD